MNDGGRLIRACVEMLDRTPRILLGLEEHWLRGSEAEAGSCVDGFGLSASLEAGWLRRGGSLPAGLSLLALLRKPWTDA